jgi:hypothetical protein
LEQRGEERAEHARACGPDSIRAMTARTSVALLVALVLLLGMCSSSGSSGKTSWKANSQHKHKPKRR